MGAKNDRKEIDQIYSESQTITATSGLVQQTWVQFLRNSATKITNHEIFDGYNNCILKIDLIEA